MEKPIGKVLIGCLFVLVLLSIPAGAFAQLPASPRRFVDNLDGRCAQVSGPALNVPLRLDHLNPLFISMHLPFENVVLGAPQQLCVPVEKNGIAPPSDTLPFIQYIDWKCCGISGPSLNLPLTLTQLNPVIASLLGPKVGVTVGVPQQLCVPVVKNNVTRRKT